MISETASDPTTRFRAMRTGELVASYAANDRAKFTEEDIAAMKTELVERRVTLPRQTPLPEEARVTAGRAIFDDSDGRDWSLPPEEFKPMTGLTTTTRGFIYATGVLTILSSVLPAQLGNEYGKQLSQQFQTTHDVSVFFSPFLLGETLFSFTCTILFLVWMHRAYSNLYPLRAPHLKYSPKWAVGGWFVPVLNIWRPYQVMREIARGSIPTFGNDREALARRIMRLVPLWWILFLAPIFIMPAIAIATGKDPSIDAFMTRWITPLIELINVVVTTTMLGMIRTMQETRIAELRAG